MIGTRILTIALAVLFFGMVFTISCTKNATPTPPIHDTITVVKNDTTIKNDTTYLVQNDTLYYSKPDSTVNLTKGLLVYLNFTGNIVDSSGNGNPTTSVGSVLTYDEHGYANNAFGGDGSSYVIVSNNGSIQFDTAWSLSVAFMVNDSRPETYVSMVDQSTGQGPSFNFGNTLATSPYYLACGSGDVSTDCSSIGQVNNYNITDTTYWLPNPGSWYKAVVIYHKGTLQTYINGTLISTKVGSGTAGLLCPNSQVIVGAWTTAYGGSGQPINGKLDNVRLYNRVVTPHEIAWLSTSFQVTSNNLRRGVRTGQAGQ
jgi:Concanavalin A-like lectin/glucanases superfamily